MSISDGVSATAANFNAAFASKGSANSYAEVQTNEKQIVIKEIATPSTPASGYGAVYFKTDGEMYVKNDAGTETKVSNAPATISNHYSMENLAIATSVAANALTVALKNKAGSDPSAGDSVQIAFRSSTATSGVFVTRTVSSSLSVVVSSGSTLGHTSSVDQYVYVYAIDNAGTVELAVSGSRLFDEGTLYNTTAEGGSGSADSLTTLYSTTARTGVAVRLIGRIKSNQATAGTWASSPTEISTNISDKFIICRSYIFVQNGNGHGSTNTKIRRFSNTRESLGSAITYADSAGNGASFTINENGLYYIQFQDSRGTGNSVVGLSLNSSSLTSDIDGLSYANGARGFVQNATGLPCQCTLIIPLRVGDVIRPHTNGANNDTTTYSSFVITQLERHT